MIESGMSLRKRAMIGEGELWKRVGAERTSRRESLALSLGWGISRTSIAACGGGSFRLKEEVEVVEGLRENTL